MSEDNVIGSIEGRATFDRVVIRPSSDGDRIYVAGHYMNDTTTYSAPEYSVKVGGVVLGQLDGEFELLPSDEIDGWVWVEATKDELLITAEKPQEKDNE